MKFSKSFLWAVIAAMTLVSSSCASRPVQRGNADPAVFSLDPVDEHIIKTLLPGVGRSDLMLYTPVHPNGQPFEELYGNPYELDWLITPRHNPPELAEDEETRRYYQRGKDLFIAWIKVMTPEETVYSREAVDDYWLCDEHVLTGLPADTTAPEVRQRFLKDPICQRFIQRVIQVADQVGSRATSVPEYIRTWYESDEAKRPAFEFSINAYGPDEDWAIFRLCQIDGALTLIYDNRNGERQANITRHETLMNNEEYTSKFAPIAANLQAKLTKADEALRQNQAIRAQALSSEALDRFYVELWKVGIPELWTQTAKEKSVGTVSVNTVQSKND